MDFGLNVQEAIDAPRFHHQWLPDKIRYERIGISPDTLALLRAKGHELAGASPPRAWREGILLTKEGVLEGGFDRRAPDGGAASR